MISRLVEKTKKTNTPICAGLDPMLSYVPGHVAKKFFDAYGETLEEAADIVWQPNKEIIDHTCDLTLAVKLQIAMYERFGIEGLIAYKRTVECRHEKGLTAIGDAKWGGAGSTSAACTAGHLGAVQVGSNVYREFGVGMPTVSPRLGTDGVELFIGVCSTNDKGLFVLVKTSNPSSGEFQDHLIGGRPLYEQVTQKMMEWGAASMDSAYSSVGATAGTIYPEVSRILRKLTPAVYSLVPGYDAQGDTAGDLKCCFNEDGLGAIANSSRGVVAAYKQDKYKQFGPKYSGEVSRQAVLDVIVDINSVL